MGGFWEFSWLFNKINGRVLEGTDEKWGVYTFKHFKHEIKALQLPRLRWKATIIPGRTFFVFTFFVAMFDLKIIYSIYFLNEFTTAIKNTNSIYQNKNKNNRQTFKRDGQLEHLPIYITFWLSLSYKIF